MSNWHQIWLEFTLRQGELIRQAERERLAYGAPKGNSLIAKALAWLGYRLIVWGSRLHNRFARVETCSEPLPNCTRFR